MSKNTKNKYYNFMMELYNQKQFNIKEMQIEHRISTRLCTLMRERGMIKREGKLTHWVGDMPTQAIASAIAKECLKQSRIANSQSKAGTHQMVIKPIKRVERPVPQSIIELNEKISEYPILDVAIAFLGGMMVAAFFTIIWK